MKSGLFKPSFGGKHLSKTRSEEWGVKERRGLQRSWNPVCVVVVAGKRILSLVPHNHPKKLA